MNPTFCYTTLDMAHDYVLFKHYLVRDAHYDVFLRFRRTSGLSDGCLGDHRQPHS